MLSLNLTEPFAWWREVDGQVQDPHDRLPPVVSEFTRAEADATEVGLAPKLPKSRASVAA